MSFQFLPIYRTVGQKCKGLKTQGFVNPNPTTTSINMEEPQPHDSQNRIIKPSDYQHITTYST